MFEENDATAQILALSLDDPLRELKARDITKRLVHSEKYFLYFRLSLDFKYETLSESTRDFIARKVETHDHLSDEWGVNFGFQFDNHLDFSKPVFQTLEDKAIYHARRWHHKQRYGREKDKPYHWHLKAVVRNLAIAGVKDADILAAGYLHDAIEDTGKTREDIAALFNDVVADLVWRVTNEPGKNRAERHLKTYGPKILGHVGATTIKLADRIANAEVSFFDAQLGHTGYWDMYKKEHPAFCQKLYVPTMLANHDTVAKLWNELDKVMRKESNGKK